MIEVSARLTRGVVYLASEEIECILTFRNPSTDLNTKAQSNSDVCETLAWASAQIHCRCTVSDDKVIFPSNSPVAQEELAVSNKKHLLCTLRWRTWTRRSGHEA